MEEIERQSENGNWEIIPLRKFPQGTSVLPAVWALKRKRRILTREVDKWKARLNLDGPKCAILGHALYAPVASWPIIRLMSVVLNWSSLVQIDYVQAYA